MTSVTLDKKYHHPDSAMAWGNANALTGYHHALSQTSNKDATTHRKEHDVIADSKEFEDEPSNSGEQMHEVAKWHEQQAGKYPKGSAEHHIHSSLALVSHPAIEGHEGQRDWHAKKLSQATTSSEKKLHQAGVTAHDAAAKVWAAGGTHSVAGPAATAKTREIDAKFIASGPTGGGTAKEFSSKEPPMHLGKSADKSPWTIYSHAFDEKKKDVGKGFKSSLTKEGKLRSSAVIKEMHHPRTATQTREAIDHLSDHSDTHTAKEQAVLEERVRRAAKKHGVSMAGAKSPKAARRLLERKARMAQKALEAIKAIKAMSSQDIEAQREKVIGPAGRYPGFKFSDGNQQMIDKFDDLLRTAKAIQNPTQLAEGHDKQSAGHFAAAQSLQQTAKKTSQSPNSPVPNLIAGHVDAGNRHREAAAAQRSGVGDPNAATRSANISSFKVGGMAKPAVSTGAKSPAGIGGSPGSSGGAGAFHSGPATSAVSSAAPTGEHMQMKALEAIKALLPMNKSKDDEGYDTVKHEQVHEHLASHPDKPEAIRRAAQYHSGRAFEHMQAAEKAPETEKKAHFAAVRAHRDAQHDFMQAHNSHVFGDQRSEWANPTQALDRAKESSHEANGHSVGLKMTGGVRVPEFKSKSEGEGVTKAMTAASMPRIPRALMNDTYRSATAVMTRDHSAIAKDMHTGPLTDEVIQELRTEEANRTRRQPVYKSCDGCGRTFMVKSMDDPCPTCSMRKSHYCSKCNSHLVKGRSGTTCPLCG